MSRLFIALPAGDDVIEFFKPHYEFLLSFKSCIKAVPVQNLHITIKFFGDCEDRLADDITGSFKNMDPGISRIPVRYKGIGTFPDLKKASVIWSGLEIEKESVEDLVRKMDDFSSPFGFPREKRRFVPHLTLARVRRDKALPPALVNYIRDNSQKEFITSSFDRITLFESRLESTGASYREINSLRLKN